MLGTQSLGLFVISGLLLNMTPGADTLYIVHHATHGFRKGFYAALGIGAGCIVHALAAALGLSALLAASAQAYMVVKWIGAVYLIYLGLNMLRSAQNSVPKKSAPKKSAPKHAEETIAIPTSLGAQQIFWRGFLTNVLNPKVALFFLAFLPQFIAPDAPSHILTMLFLGLVFDINGTLWNIFMAWLASSVAQRFQSLRLYSLWFKRAVGVLFVFFGGKLALTKS